MYIYTVKHIVCILSLKWENNNNNPIVAKMRVSLIIASVSAKVIQYKEVFDTVFILITTILQVCF